MLQFAVLLKILYTAVFGIMQYLINHLNHSVCYFFLSDKNLNDSQSETGLSISQLEPGMLEVSYHLESEREWV